MGWYNVTLFDHFWLISSLLRCKCNKNSRIFRETLRHLNQLFLPSYPWKISQNLRTSSKKPGTCYLKGDLINDFGYQEHISVAKVLFVRPPLSCGIVLWKYCGRTKSSTMSSKTWLFIFFCLTQFPFSTKNI